MNALTDGTSWATRPAARPSASAISRRSATVRTMSRTSSSVSVGRPDLEVELQAREPVREDEPRPSRGASASETFLLMWRRSRSLPASGAIASARSPCRARTSRIGRLDRVDLDRGERDVELELREPGRISVISGWSQTAVAIRPVRSVSGRASRATFRIDAAGYCLIGAIAYAAQQKRHISVQPREISIRSLSASSVRGVRIVVCGTSKAGVISLRDIGCWMTTLPLSARLGARALDRRHEEAGQLRGGLEELLAREARLRRAPRSRGTSRSPSPEREDVDERRERRRVHARDVAADEEDRDAARRARARRSGMPRRAERLQDVDDVHLPGERPGEEAEVRRAACPLSNVTRRLPLLEEEPLADEVRHAVEEAVDPLEAEVRHPDLVGVRKARARCGRPRTGSGSPCNRSREASSRFFSVGLMAKRSIIGRRPRATWRFSRAEREDPVADVRSRRAGDEEVAERARRRAPCRAARARPPGRARGGAPGASVVPSAKAPAALELPSTPSEPAESSGDRRPGERAPRRRARARGRARRCPCARGSRDGRLAAREQHLTPGAGAARRAAEPRPSPRASPRQPPRPDGDLAPQPERPRGRRVEARAVRADDATSRRRGGRGSSAPSRRVAGRSPGTSDSTSVTSRGRASARPEPPALDRGERAFAVG